MSTPNLAIPHIAASQNQKEVTANDAFDRLDEAICGLTAISLTGQTSPLVLAPATALRCAVLQLDPEPSGRRLRGGGPTNRKPYTVRNLSGGAVTLRTAAGAGVAVADGQVRLLYADGTDVVDLSPGRGRRGRGAGRSRRRRHRDRPAGLRRRPALERHRLGAVSARARCRRVRSRPARGRGPGVQARRGARLHPAGRAHRLARPCQRRRHRPGGFRSAKNGSSIGTASFAAGSATATFTLASATSLAEGDRLELIAPTPQDATLADLTILLKGSLA